jgi:acetolactate synthase-1/2/3 large subunit
MMELLHERKSVDKIQFEPINVSDTIVHYLHELGCDFVFGVPGGAIEPFFNSLSKSEKSGLTSLVIARHEAGAAFMADGYYRETGKLPVICSTTGPGATNLLTGVASAFVEHIPMLIITAQTPLPKFGRRALQESSGTSVDIMSMFAPVTVYNTMITHPDQLGYNLVAAINAAWQKRGPVHLSIPSDVMREPLSLDTLPNIVKRFSSIDDVAISSLNTLLREAASIAVVVGENIDDAHHEIEHFIEQTAASFVCTPIGKSFVNEKRISFAGVFGFAGHESAKALLANPNVDLIICAGMTLDELSTSGWSDLVNNEKVVHIGSIPECFVRADKSMHVFGDVKRVFKKLNYALTTYVKTRERIGAPLEQKQYSKCVNACNPIKPQYLMEYLSAADVNPRYFIDAGNSWAWATHYLLTRNNEGLYRIGMGFGSMGWAIGAAVGSAMSRNPTVCIVGDGSYLMSAQEITVAQQYSLPLIFIVLNDSSLGMVYHGQKLGGQESIGWELPFVDFAKQAEAMGVESYVVKSSDDLNRLDLRKLFNRKKPIMIDVRIDRNEVPPMGERVKGIAGTPGA